MEITEVRIKLMEEPGERLKAFCSITFDDCFVVRDLKIIEGTSGPFVAMPSRKLTDRCNKCGCKNHLRARFCNGCGHRLEREGEPDARGEGHQDPEQHGPTIPRASTGDVTWETPEGSRALRTSPTTDRLPGPWLLSRGHGSLPHPLSRWRTDLREQGPRRGWHPTL